MKINEFAQKVCRAVEKELGKPYRTELKMVQKNNGVEFHGLLILLPERNVVPTIYLETFYEAYEGGVPFADVLGRVLMILRDEIPGSHIDTFFFESFEKAKERICYRLIGRQDNERLLSDIPYVEFLDLAICFYYAYSGSDLGEGTILIHNSHMEHWNANVKDLMMLAQENTPRLFPSRLTSMQEMLEELMDAHEEIPADADVPLAVLTNAKRCHGAACMLYPGLLEKIAGKKNSGFYIIPSSIHEVLLLDKSGVESPGEVKMMIHEVNRQHVAKEDILSDSLYYYDISTGAVRIIL